MVLFFGKLEPEIIIEISHIAIKNTTKYNFFHIFAFR